MLDLPPLARLPLLVLGMLSLLGGVLAFALRNLCRRHLPWLRSR